MTTILNEETRRKLRELNLGEMIDAIDTQSQDIGYSMLSFEDRMKMAVDYVYQKKYNSKVQQQSTTTNQTVKIPYI